MSVSPRLGRVWLAVALALPAIALVTPTQTVEAAAVATVGCDDPLQTTVPTVPAVESYTSITPLRLVDTRDGTGGYTGVVEAGCTMRLQLADSVIPANAVAAALSVIAVAEEKGFITAFPCDDGRPLASSINARAGIPTANLVVAVLDGQRDVCIYSLRASNIVIDLQGWWGTGSSRFRPVDPIRAYDTRELAVPAKLPGGGTRDVLLAGDFVPAEATSVVINLTATETATSGWLVAYPCGETPPTASNLNYTANETRAVAAIVGLGTRNGGQGAICIKTLADTHFIVDVVGYYAPVPDFGPSTQLLPVQQRLVDTRDATGPWDTPFAARQIREIDPTIGLERADDATAVVINAIGLNAASRGHLTVFPCSEVPPLVSTLNMSPERTVSNLLTVELSDAGTICVLSSAGADVVLDLVGLMVTTAGAPLREMTITGAEVWPDFTVDGTDYALECDAGINELTISISSHRGRVVRVDGNLVADNEASARQLSADDLLTVELSGAGVAPVEYNFRCLPGDFPDMTVDQPGDPQPGWYLTGISGDVDTGVFAVILDERGVPVWYQRTALWAINVQRLASGSVMYDIADSNGYGYTPEGVATIIGLDGALIDEVTTDDPTAFPLDHHELLERPNPSGPSDWTVLSYPFIDEIDLTVLGTGFGAAEPAASSVIREIGAPATDDDPAVLQWEWDALDHFDVAEVQYPQRFNNYVPPGSPGEVDLFHINSLDRQPDGDYVVSARHLDAVFRVDRDTGDVQWILSSEPAGGVIPNKNDAPRLTIIGDALGGPRRQHDARLVGNVLTLFDNRRDAPGAARAVAYEIDEVAGTATLLWQIDEPLGRSSGGLGSVRVGPDGSRLVAWGGLQPMFTEFDADGELLLAISVELSGRGYRIVKYAPDVFDVAELRAGASSTQVLDGPP